MTNKNTFFSETKDIIIILAVIFLIRSFGFGLYQVPTGSMEPTMLCGERFFADKFTPLFLPFKHGDIVTMNQPTFKYSENWLMKLWEKFVWGPSNWTKRVIGVPGDVIKGTIEDGKAVIYRNGQKLEEPYVNQYPLIGVWNMDPLKAHEKIRKELGQAANTRNEEMLQQILSQSFYRDCSLRTFDPSESYEQQPFYKMSTASVFKGFGETKDSKPFLVYPNDVTVAQPQNLVKRDNSYWSGGSDEFYVELGDDEYWLMGDNRKNSHDARFFGPVKSENIRGKVLFRILSVMPAEYEASFSDGGSLLEQAWIYIRTSLFGEILLHPISYWSRVRWNRCLQQVKG